jgi:ATP-dependent Lon protease
MVIMPGTMTHFDITRHKSMLAVDHAMSRDQKICLLTQNIAETEDPGEDNLHRIGVVCSVLQVMRLPNHAIRVLVDGGTRAELLRMTQLVPYLEGEVLEIPFSNEINDMLREEAMLRVLREAVNTYAAQNKALEEIKRFADSCTTLEELMNTLMVRMDLPWQEKQKLLETDSVYGRYDYLCTLLERERDVARLKKEIQQKVRESIDKTQKEYLIREQIKALREELGEGDRSEMD